MPQNVHLTKSFLAAWERLTNGSKDEPGIVRLVRRDGGKSEIDPLLTELMDRLRAPAPSAKPAWDALRTKILQIQQDSLDATVLLTELEAVLMAEVYRMTDVLGEYSDHYRQSFAWIGWNSRVEEMRGGVRDFLDPKFEVSTVFEHTFEELVDHSTRLLRGDGICDLKGIDRYDVAVWSRDLISRIDILDQIIHGKW